MHRGKCLISPIVRHTKGMSVSVKKTRNPRVRLVWHRRDLRLHDNPLYHDDGSNNDDDTKFSTILKTNTNPTFDLQTISLYVFDRYYFHPQPSTACPQEWDTILCGPHAARASIEAVTELRQSLRDLGSELLIRSTCNSPQTNIKSNAAKEIQNKCVNDAAQVVFDVAKSIGATEVCWNEEPGVYERELSLAVKDLFQNQEDVTNICRVWTDVTYTLYHPNDLPRKADDWDRLAHPKQKRSKKKKKRKSAGTHNPETKRYDVPQSDDATICDNFIDIIPPERMTDAPKIMGDFRRACRSFASIRVAKPPPANLQKPELAFSNDEDIGALPTLRELMEPMLLLSNDNATEKNDQLQQHRSILGLESSTLHNLLHAAETLEHVSLGITSTYGERSALDRLEHFVNDGQAVVADRSLADVGIDGSSKFSTHLALGTLSPRVIVEKVLGSPHKDGCKWLISHLEMRDFFLYTAFSAHNKLYRRDGLPVSGSSKKKKTDMNKPPITWTSPLENDLTRSYWKRWSVGHTNLPLVDAAMRELLQTGYCSNRVRQNAASVLTKDLKLDWRAGAELFQFMLRDHCVGANWGNWMYFSGVGSDPKQRHFRTVSQAKRYDPYGLYVQKWVSELKADRNDDNDVNTNSKAIIESETDMNDIKTELYLRPWDFRKSWPQPIVDAKTQYTWQDSQLLQEHGRLMVEEGIFEQQ